MQRSIKLPCPKSGRPLETVELEVGIRSAFCMWCSAWHNWTHRDIEQLKERKKR